MLVASDEIVRACKISQAYNSVDVGWLRPDRANFVERPSSCKAFMCDQLKVSYFANYGKPTLRYYVVTGKIITLALDVIRLRQYFATWENAFGLPPSTVVQAYKNTAAYRITVPRRWLYGPAGIQTHTMLARSGARWATTNDNNPLTFLARIGTVDAEYYRNAIGELSHCFYTKTLPHCHATWSHYKNRTVHCEGLAQCSVKREN